MPDRANLPFPFGINIDGSTSPQASGGGWQLVYADPLDGSLAANWSTQIGITWTPSGAQLVSGSELVLAPGVLPASGIRNFAMEIEHVSGSIPQSGTPQSPAGLLLFENTDNAGSGRPYTMFGTGALPGNNKLWRVNVAIASSAAQVTTPTNPPNWIRTYCVFRNNIGPVSNNVFGFLHAENWKSAPVDLGDWGQDTGIAPEITTGLLDSTSGVPMVNPVIEAVGLTNPIVVANFKVWTGDAIFLPQS